MNDIKNVKFVAEVSLEFGKDYEIVVTCALGSFSLSLLSISYLSTNYFLTEQGSKFKMIFWFEGGRINVNMRDLMITSEMLTPKESGTPDNVAAIQVRCMSL